MYSRKSKNCDLQCDYMRLRGSMPSRCRPLASVVFAAQKRSNLALAVLVSAPLTLSALFAWLVTCANLNRYCTRMHGSIAWQALCVMSGNWDMVNASSNASFSFSNDQSACASNGIPAFLSILHKTRMNNHSSTVIKGNLPAETSMCVLQINTRVASSRCHSIPRELIVL